MYNHLLLKDIVERAISELSYNTETENLIEPVRYILSIGGKRLRPVLALMACNLFKDKIDEAVMPAAGIEIFHNFTLVHDDIIDNAEVRRNYPTVHIKWDINQAVLSGDVMAFIANDCFLQAPSRCMAAVFRIFNKVAIEVCTGQQMDIDFEKKASVLYSEYIRMIELKTAVLLAASVKIGAIIGGAEDHDANLLYEFGRNIGLAFQVQDDLLDIYGDVKKFGKIQGGDILSNKKTILLVKATEIASHEQLKKLHELYTASNIDPDSKVNNVIELYNQLNIKSIVENIAREYTNVAFRSLEMTKVDKNRKTELIQLATSLVLRDR